MLVRMGFWGLKIKIGVLKYLEVILRFLVGIFDNVMDGGGGREFEYLFI